MPKPVITSIEAAKQALDALGLKYKHQNGGLLAQCPAHSDANASCSIVAGRDGEGAIIVHCFAGCDWPDIKLALESAPGLPQMSTSTSRPITATGARPATPTAARKPPVQHGRRVEQARYLYRLADGSTAFTKIRYGYPDSPKMGHKTFLISPRDQTALKDLKAQSAVPVYNLPELRQCVAAGVAVMVGEGEKDCDTAKRHGRTMICGHAGAAQTLPPEFAEQIRGLRLLGIVPDRDEPGIKYALNWIEIARKAEVPFKVLRTPLDTKGADLTDHFQAGYGWDDLLDVTEEFLQLDNAAAPTVEPVPPSEVVTLAQCEDTYRKWMSAAYDMSVVHANLAARAAHDLEGEPVWLLTVAGSASGKTEGIAPLAATPGAVMVSEISSAGALLSGTSSSERSKDATGGLLNQIGASGTLILKDFTTILSKSSDSRNEVLAALREVYDGSWKRVVGTDGGKTLSWAGRISLLGATTTTYDRHSSVIAVMGDRFALIRMDSRVDRRIRGLQALMNTGHEALMREELSKAAAGVIAGMDRNPAPLDDAEKAVLFYAADYVTMARTPAERDSRQEPIEQNDPESPQRLVKVLQQIMLGGVAIGMSRRDAMLLSLRVAHDTIPPVRRKVLEAVLERPGSATADVVEATQIPRTTIDRMLQELALQGLLVRTQGLRYDGAEGGRWRYSLAEGIDPRVVTRAALEGAAISGPSAEGMPSLDNAAKEAATQAAFPGLAVCEDPVTAPTDLVSTESGPVSPSRVSGEVVALSPGRDISAETCDEHLLATDNVIKACPACRETKNAAAA